MIRATPHHVIVNVTIKDKTNCNKLPKQADDKVFINSQIWCLNFIFVLFIHVIHLFAWQVLFIDDNIGIFTEPLTISCPVSTCHNGQQWFQVINWNEMTCFTRWTSASKNNMWHAPCVNPVSMKSECNHAGKVSFHIKCSCCHASIVWMQQAVSHTQWSWYKKYLPTNKLVTRWQSHFYKMNILVWLTFITY